MSYKIIDLPALGRQFNATDIIEVSANGTGSYKANIGNFTLGGENYIFVNANGTPAQNGAAVRAAYTAAIAMTPNGVAKSATNRVIILLAPGYYDFNEGVDGDFIIDQSFIDFESLSGFTDVYFSSMNIFSTGTGKNIYISGINTTKNSFYPTGPFALYTTGGINELIYIKDCVGGDYSFGVFSSGFVGVIDNCVAGNYSYGYTSDVAPIGLWFVGINPTNYGTYKNCTGGNYCFLSSDSLSGGSGTVTNYGTIENCKAGANSFLYSAIDSSSNIGTISNCVSTGSKSFCVTEGFFYVTNQGLISSCIGTNNSFVVGYNLSSVDNSGKIINCITTSNNCFVVNPSSPSMPINYGLISDCNAYNSNLAFCGREGQNYGFISNCIAASQAFCNGIALNIFEDIYRCTMTNDTFIVGTTSGGRVVLGIDNTGVVNY